MRSVEILLVHGVTKFVLMFFTLIKWLKITAPILKLEIRKQSSMAI